MRPGRLGCGVAVLWLGLFCGTLSATTIDPLTFEELAYGTDLFGIVKCVTAGGIVANYEVEEVWIGKAPDGPIAVHVATNYWEPQFPIAVVGERYVIAATGLPSTIASTTIGGPVPLWWRVVPADYRLPLFQGRVRLPASEGRIRSSLGSEAADVDQLRKECMAFVGLSLETQRLRVLQRLARKYVFSRDTFSDEATRETVEDAGDVRTAIEALLAYQRTVDKSAWSGVSSALERCPGDEVFTIVEAIDVDESPFDSHQHQRLLRGLKWRREPPTTARSEPTEAPLVEGPELETMRHALEQGLDHVEPR